MYFPFFTVYIVYYIDKPLSVFDFRFKNEVKSLNLLSNSKHIPNIIRVDNDEKSIYLEDCGVYVTNENIPLNWKEQMLEIIDDMKKANIYHNDLWYENILVKDGILFVIDFSYATVGYEGFPYINIAEDEVNKIDDFISYTKKLMKKNGRRRCKTRRHLIKQPVT